MSAGKDKRSSIAFNGGVAMVLSAMKANPNDASVCCIAILLFCSTSRPYFFSDCRNGMPAASHDDVGSGRGDPLGCLRQTDSHNRIRQTLVVEFESSLSSFSLRREFHLASLLDS